MKQIQALFAAVLCGVLSSVAVNASAQSGHPGYATVIRVQGIVSYSLGDANWHPLLAGKYLPVGAILRTGDNGVVDVVLGKSVDVSQAAWQPDRIGFAPDSPVRGMISYKPASEQNVVRLLPETTMAIDKLNITDTSADTVSDTELNLKKGKIFCSVKKLTGASEYLIKLPNGIAGVRGTRFSISANGDVACFESTGGGVVLSLVQADGITKTFVVTPGQALDVTTGQLGQIQADLNTQLSNFFNAIQTIYLRVAAFIPGGDSTRCYISPVHGGSGGHGHGHGKGV